MKRNHSIAVRLRGLSIWQKRGYFPWRKQEAVSKTVRKGSRDFYRGAFATIPFLNEDAKRTFLHLLLRPGYMIRDYIRGDHERYLAPLTALIIFYAFFALVSAVLEPIQHKQKELFRPITIEQMEFDTPEQEKTFSLFTNTMNLLRKGWLYLNLDRYPEEVDTQQEKSLAALEGTLRSQGIPLFVGPFFLLWLAMAAALRRFRMGMSAYAAATAYILCQFSFFMLFAVLFTFGESTSISAVLMLFLLTVDYHQWLGTGYKRSLRLAIRTSILYGILFVLVIVIAVGISALVVWLRSR